MDTDEKFEFSAWTKKRPPLVFPAWTTVRPGEPIPQETKDGLKEALKQTRRRYDDDARALAEAIEQGFLSATGIDRIQRALRRWSAKYGYISPEDREAVAFENAPDFQREDWFDMLLADRRIAKREMDAERLRLNDLALKNFFPDFVDEEDN